MAVRQGLQEKLAGNTVQLQKCLKLLVKTRTLGKSWGVFLVAIFVAREMAKAEAEQAIEAAAQKVIPS